MKSIYNQDDLSCNSTGSNLLFEARNFFQSMLEKYPEYNPREMVELFSSEFSIAASRRILTLRNLGMLKPHEHITGQTCSLDIDCDAVRCQNARYAEEDKNKG